MQHVRVIAIQDFELQGRAVYAGQAVQLLPIDAAVRARRGEVSLDPQMQETYQTRDMVAEQPVQAIRIVVPVVATAILVTPGLLPPLRNDDPVTRTRRTRKPKPA